tara:strand:+ start:370 stop:603 length:234 start_codon:yes stop_codon:yes gene_type:complete
MAVFRLEDSIGNSFVVGQPDGTVWAGARLVGNGSVNKVFDSQSTMLDVAKAVRWIAIMHSQDSGRQIDDYTWVDIKS